MNSTEHLIKIALKEDIGSGDITTDNLVDPDLEGKGVIIAKEPFIIAGLDVACQVFKHLNANVIFIPVYIDGNLVKEGETIATVKGKLRALLLGERTALNFLQRLSGIATCVRSYVDELKNKRVRLVDTRKTTPGWRVLEKYAVRVGGAHNHRMGLYDGVLIKDNHIAACGGIKKAVDRIRTRVSHLVKIEVEVSTLDQVKDALKAGADVIMLDNMSIEQIKEAAAFIDEKALVEVSGNVTKSGLKSLADAGVDIISVGALTHSAGCVDISMRIQTAD
ncbi:MAG: carboxylating nicotinate-nucleotide diphosphorylase [Proteobacteria bacterium]|jgi:nicotinate-nucleotide pyrophosphorylase (carboxylating)|nr:carboxylating nicotinate-nucleotide diphosphorylase [Pseudomonadota bacterium]OEU63358.1 MAG: nicotinate-nucleotide diphosphorylase (carboxylating) [Desulfobacterales bacterium S5133MH16]